MGTRGYFAFRWRGVYYVVYNNYDSYFSWLGYKLIDAIRELTKEQWDEIKQKLAAHSAINDDRGSEDGYEDVVPTNMKKNENILLTVMNSYSGSFVTRAEPELDCWIEYVYILDLDVDVFTAISRHHKDEELDDEMRYTCRFENLSKQWLDSCDSW